MSEFKPDWSSFVPPPNYVRISINHPSLRASDNRRHYANFKQLVSDGIKLNVEVENIENLPSFNFRVAESGGVGIIWLLPAMERFLLHYLNSGKNSPFPNTPTLQELVDFKSEDDYIYRHIKREIERGNFNHDPVTQDGIDGTRFIGLYPYGSIDYGFIPYTWDGLLTRLDDIEPFVYNYPERDIPDLHNTTLPIEERELPAGEYLDYAFKAEGYHIPTNTIIDKTICGIGATWMEINDMSRSSIIVEPNVPVIIGKVQQHPHLIPFWEKADKRNSAQEIQNRLSAKEPVKIITTPDTYRVAVGVLATLSVDYRNDFFLLFDECEKIVSDINYRPNVDLPIEDFFRFRGKAMVSATPIIINDPRFEQHGFRIIKIIPLFDYRQTLELKPTNNVNLTLKRSLSKISEDAVICFFYNSINGIEEVIDYLNIPIEQANIYCSTKAAKKLRKDRYNVFDSVTDMDGNYCLNKFNFFTSRFYSAVDIKVDCKPVIIMVTNVYKAIKDETPYTFIDPETEAIQIAGRFRNGIDRLIHITNTNADDTILTREQVEEYLRGQHEGYLKLVDLYNSIENKPINGEKSILDEAIRKTDYFSQRFVNDLSEINYFRYNNCYIDERLKLLYSYPAPLLEAYKRSMAFNVISESVYAVHNDEERRTLKDRNCKKSDRIKLLHKILKQLEDSDNPYDRKFVHELIADYPLYIKAFTTIGYPKVRELEYKDSDIKTAVNQWEFDEQVKRDDVVRSVYEVFKEDTPYPIAFINEQLKAVYTDHGLNLHRHPKGEDICYYFDAKPFRTRNERGWRLGKKFKYDV